MGQTDLIARTRELWGQRYGREITDEEAQEIIDNMAAFARVLIDRYVSDRGACMELRNRKDGNTSDQAPPRDKDV